MLVDPATQDGERHRLADPDAIGVDVLVRGHDHPQDEGVLRVGLRHQGNRVMKPDVMREHAGFAAGCGRTEQRVEDVGLVGVEPAAEVFAPGKLPEAGVVIPGKSNVGMHWFEEWLSTAPGREGGKLCHTKLTAGDPGSKDHIVRSPA